MAETETTDDRVKDRFGGWQDSETRKHIYQDRETQELRAEAANVRRRPRLGPSAQAPSSEPNEPNGRPPVDLDAILALLSDEQRAVLAARLDAAASSDVPTDARSEDEPHERLFLLLTKQFLIPYLERGRRGTI